ncbi:peptidoglycan-associated lipoprotein Pal [Solimicrobium silvestre]|uniref:Peptidoglycan-associated lipoprotein n=1 Tax=Solimicrobium silvestre TaxID=2099400 RepID=A0A2S9GTS7_9BURK|nr:peptidoglycan-associated lipoprotein Pal [Solimicrobium silvestre]PRC91103.1 Peptidoglycan-associated lipoprotein [Solimicrobium silvestre]
MKQTLTTIALATTAALLVTACGTTPKVATSVPTPVAAAPAPAQVRTVAAVVAPVLDPLNDAHGMLAKRSIYFDFDQYSIKPEFAALNTAHANYLVSHTARSIVIQGNTDSRGGAEYNLALGEKRAEAELKALAASGVPSSRMEAVSFGKEKPKASGNDAAAWAENRRADLVYAGK